VTGLTYWINLQKSLCLGWVNHSMVEYTFSMYKALGLITNAMKTSQQKKYGFQLGACFCLTCSEWEKPAAILFSFPVEKPMWRTRQIAKEDLGPTHSHKWMNLWAPSPSRTLRWFNCSLWEALSQRIPDLSLDQQRLWDNIVWCINVLNFIYIIDNVKVTTFSLYYKTSWTIYSFLILKNGNL
jgi:hypothetical protein